MRNPTPRKADLSSRLGKSMLVGAWVLGLGLLVLFFDDLLDGQRNPNRNPDLQFSTAGQPEVVLKRNRQGHYVATGRINGTPTTFLLDTGATNIALPRALAEQMGLPLRPGGLSKTANGVVQTWSTRLDSVSLGGLTARNLHAVVMPNMPGNQVLLGMNFLQDFDLIQRGDRLTLRVPG